MDAFRLWPAASEDAAAAVAQPKDGGGEDGDEGWRQRPPPDAPRPASLGGGSPLGAPGTIIPSTTARQDAAAMEELFQTESGRLDSRRSQQLEWNRC